MATLPLANSDQVAIVDDDWFEILSLYRWKIDDRGRVVGPGNRLLHRIVAGCWTGQHVHHRDHDQLNNRRCNLVALSPEDHRALHSAERSALTGLPRGVRPSGRSWVAAISAGGRQVHLGSFATVEAASAAYEVARRERDKR